MISALKETQQGLGRKPDLLSLTNSQRNSGWVRLVQTASDQVGFPPGTLCLNKDGERQISASCSRGEINSTDLIQTRASVSDAGLKTALGNNHGFVAEILISYLSH